MAIVVMGDDEGVASSLVRRLAELGYDAAFCGAGGIAAIGGVDLLVCPFHDAPTLQRRVAPSQALLECAPAVLACVAAPSAEDLRLAMALGFDDALDWPAADASVTEVIERNLRRARARRAADPLLAQQVSDLQRDQRAGRYIQMGMLPPSPMAIDQYRLRHRIHPSLMLSGDFVDYFRITDDHFVFYIADVSGHGASSAFVTVILKNFSRRLRREYRPRMLRAPGDILVALNREILENRIDKHVAMFVGVVNMRENELHYANAGHFPHAIRVHDGEASLLEAMGKPVGLFEQVDYESEAVAFGEGDDVVLMSDGVLEVMKDAGLDGKERQLREAAATCGADIDGLWATLGVNTDAAGPDDITCLTVTCGHFS